MTNSSLIVGFDGGSVGTFTDTNQTFFAFTSTLLNIALALSETESLAQITFRTAGTMSFLQVNVMTGTASGSSTIVLRRNGSTVNESISVAQGVTGLHSDASHTDNITGGDKLCVGITPGDTNLVISCLAAVYTPNTVSITLSKLCSYFLGGLATSNSVLFPIPTGVNGNTVEADGKLRIRKTFTAKNACINIVQAFSTTETFRSRVGGANGNIAISTGTSATGVLEDTSNSDNLSLGSDYNFTWTVTPAAVGIIELASIELQSSNNDILYSVGNDALTTFNTSVTEYFGLAGNLNSPVTTEANAKITTNLAMTFSQLGCNVFSNGISTTSTINLRANGANAGPTLSIQASTNGLVFDNSNTYSAASTDVMDYQIITGSTGSSLKLSFITINGNSGAAAPATGPNYQNFGKQRQNYQSFGQQMVIFG